ncbi:glycosyltransferase family 2 protein [candidate division KSB1 bacterium]|nr:glycosyltransferase family 2 protein [candidate division KSB1 bacterium]NIR71801.1 glycosyltransferase family 2 protein [candidate division KSB1 bacterium]NIS27255.1 glycosyltransferase family 2 protein [candidate division KSB1 bacterium]NIT74140.1 glycosyltransferase family 2 protein [candidate division KSB1 bacterium]NIU27989.1 glycosyltransferase family 2 protein [candidate division KSB1 bacterium]
MSHEREIEISVVIVTYNNEPVISSCLHSLLTELANGQHQIIIVDNNSSDGTRGTINTVVNEVGAAAFKIIENSQNLGFTKALNQGLKKSSGKHILILNPDTIVQPSSLKTLLSRLSEDNKVGMTAPQLLNPDGTVQPSCRRFPVRRDVLFEISGLSSAFRESKLFSRWKMGDFNHLSCRCVDQPQGACLLFERRLLDQVGLWDERFPMFFSDVDWCKRVKSHGYEILFEPAAKVVHYKGLSIKQKRPAMICSSHRSFYMYFKKHKHDFIILNEILGVILFVTAPLRILWFWLSGEFQKS